MASRDERVDVPSPRRRPRSTPGRRPGRPDVDPAIVGIVTRARTLSAHEIWRLGLALRELDYSRQALEIAARRSGRVFEARQIQSEVTDAVYAATSDTPARAPLALFGLLFDASIATANAALAALLSDRLSAERAAALQSPWLSVAKPGAAPEIALETALETALER